MTPDDKRRLAEIESDRAKYGLAKDDTTTLGFLLRLIHEATALEDAAMAALREASHKLHPYAVGTLAGTVAEYCDRVVAAHSAATKNEAKQ